MKTKRIWSQSVNTMDDKFAGFITATAITERYHPSDEVIKELQDKAKDNDLKPVGKIFVIKEPCVNWNNGKTSKAIQDQMVNTI